MQRTFLDAPITGELTMHYARWLWAILAIVWLVMAFAIKRAKLRETRLEGLQHLAPVFVGFWLVFGQRDQFAILNFRLLPNLPAIWWMGLVLTATGVFVAIWARLSLGTNWSGTVTLKDNHELIRKGLYSRIRHPIYTGILLALIGTGMIHGQARDLLGFLILYVAFHFKAKREEAFLQQEFGANFVQHQRHTGMFFPKI